MRKILSFDLGGTNVRCGLLDEEGRILQRAKSTTGSSPEDVTTAMARMADDCLRLDGSSRRDIACVGIGSPGPLDSRTGLIIETPNLGWRNVPLAQLLQRQLGLPVFLENDANSACWGEFWLGAGQGVKTMFILTLGTGVGGGLIIDGRLWKGIDDIAGHLGHVVVDPDGPIQVRDNPGSVEALCSATACIKAAREAAQRHPKSLLAGVPPERIDGAFVNACAEQGDPHAREIFARIGTYLGILCASLANALNPECGVIGGGLAQAGDKILLPLRKELLRRGLATASNRLKICLAQLGDDAGMVGAAGLALRRLDGLA